MQKKTRRNTSRRGSPKAGRKPLRPWEKMRPLEYCDWLAERMGLLEEVPVYEKEVPEIDPEDFNKFGEIEHPDPYFQIRTKLIKLIQDAFHVKQFTELVMAGYEGLGSVTGPKSFNYIGMEQDGTEHYLAKPPPWDQEAIKNFPGAVKRLKKEKRLSVANSWIEPAIEAAIEEARQKGKRLSKTRLLEIARDKGAPTEMTTLSRLFRAFRERLISMAPDAVDAENRNKQPPKTPAVL